MENSKKFLWSHFIPTEEEELGHKLFGSCQPRFLAFHILNTTFEDQNRIWQSIVKAIKVVKTHVELKQEYFTSLKPGVHITAEKFPERLPARSFVIIIQNMTNKDARRVLCRILNKGVKDHFLKIQQVDVYTGIEDIVCEQFEEPNISFSKIIVNSHSEGRNKIAASNCIKLMDLDLIVLSSYLLNSEQEPTKREERKSQISPMIEQLDEEEENGEEEDSGEEDSERDSENYSERDNQRDSDEEEDSRGDSDEYSRLDSDEEEDENNDFKENPNFVPRKCGDGDPEDLPDISRLLIDEVVIPDKKSLLEFFDNRTKDDIKGKVFIKKIVKEGEKNKKYALFMPD